MQKIYGVTQPIYETRIVAAFESYRDALDFTVNLHDCERDAADDHIREIPFLEDVERIKAILMPHRASDVAVVDYNGNIVETAQD